MVFYRHRTPLRAALAANVMNFSLDFFLVFGPPQLGVAGAAIATTVSQVPLEASIYPVSYNV